jgi:hypothetical protein
MTLKEKIILNTLQIDSEPLLLRLYAFMQLLRQEADLPLPGSQHLPTIGGLKVYTVEEVSQPSYIHQNPAKEQLVGAWPGDEPVDVLLKMVRK